MGIGDDNIAERRLRLLRSEFTVPGRRGPTPKPEYTAAGRQTPHHQASGPAHPSTPLNLDVIDHIGRCEAEVADHVRTDAPDAGPRPKDPAGVYTWWRENTPELDAQSLLVREAVIYRQGLEHAITMGDADVIGPHPCPACHCYGLFWQHSRQIAVCVNMRCRDQDGMAHTWSLARLAREHVARQNKLNANAT